MNIEDFKAKAFTFEIGDEPKLDALCEEWLREDLDALYGKLERAEQDAKCGNERLVAAEREMERLRSALKAADKTIQDLIEESGR